MNANQCALNRIECALSVQCERALSKLHYLRIGTLSSCLIKSGILNHVEEGRGKCGVYRMVDDLFKSLNIDKGEWLVDIKHGDI